MVMAIHHFTWQQHNGHLPVVQCLCERRAYKKERGEYDRTPLHLAACEGHLPVVQYLCEQEQGADKEARTISGWTPLHWAAHRGCPAVVQYL